MPRKKPVYTGTIICKECGQEAPRRGPRNIYCLPCSEKRNANTKRLWARKNPQPYDPERVSQERKIRQEALRQAGALGGNGPTTVHWMAESSEPALLWRTCVAVPFDYGFSKNAIWRNVTASHVVMRKEARQKREHLAARLRESLWPTVEGAPQIKVAHNKLWVDIFVEKPNHRGDATNVVDLVCDAIEDATGLDDRWYSIRRLDWAINKNEPRLLVGIGQETNEDRIICSYCGKMLPLDEFGKNAAAPLGRNRACKPCRSASRKLRGEGRKKR